MKTRKKSLKPDENLPQYFEPKPNPMFPEWLTAMLSFVRYPQPVACAHCGKKKRRGLWTLCVPFVVAEAREGSFTVEDAPKVHPGYTPVCDEHFLRPAFKDPKGDAETLLAVLSEADRELSVRGPGGFAFPMAGAWFTTDDINADSVKLGSVVRHASLAHALDCISAKIPERGRAKR